MDISPLYPAASRRTALSLLHWRRGFLAVALFVGAFTLLPGGPHSAAAEVGGVDAFTTLKTLAGTWQGKGPSGETVVVAYKIAAGGTTVIETQSPAEADEMVTVYSLSGPDLVLTHYCPMGGHGNQPHMALDRSASTGGDLRFRFVSVANLDPAKEMHTHSGRLILRDGNHLRREWDIFMNGAHASTITYDLTRKAPR